MAVNKVIYGNDTLIDLTGDTVTPNTLIQGATAHSANGEQISGQAVINDATLTIQKNGTDVATFTANSSTDVTANITVPTNLSDLSDDATHRVVTDTEKSAWDGKLSNLVVLDYGSSKWDDFISALQKNAIIYCRAGAGSTPAASAKPRYAFLAYIDGTASNPNSAEFQYYRSISSHNFDNQGDEIYIYKLAKNGTWTNEVRKAFTRIVNGTGINRSYSNGAMTLSLSDTTAKMTTNNPTGTGSISINRSSYGSTGNKSIAIGVGIDYSNNINIELSLDELDTENHQVKFKSASNINVPGEYYRYVTVTDSTNTYRLEFVSITHITTPEDYYQLVLSNPSDIQFESGVTYTATKTEGSNAVIASAPGSVAIGDASRSTNNNTVTLGRSNLASAVRAIAIGTGNTANGYGSIAMGAQCKTTANYSFTANFNNTASGVCSAAFGEGNTASGYTSFVCGKYSTASNTCAIAMGDHVTASGYCSSAFGSYSEATKNFSWAYGNACKATEDYAHAEGDHVTASGKYSHAEGQETTASYNCCHAEGWKTKATADQSHAEGSWCTASGHSSHAQGYDTIAASAYQDASGKWNIADSNNIYAAIVGNGTSNNARSNAYTLDWSGNGWFAGNVSVGNNHEILAKEKELKLVRDKWVGNAKFTDYTNYLSLCSTYVSSYFTTDAPLTDAINGTWTAELPSGSFWASINFSTSDEQVLNQLKGKTIEFGIMEETKTYSSMQCAFNIKTTSGGLQYHNDNGQSDTIWHAGSTLFRDLNHYRSAQLYIPDDITEIQFQIQQASHGASTGPGTLTITNVYAVDVNQYPISDEDNSIMKFYRYRADEGLPLNNNGFHIMDDGKIIVTNNTGDQVVTIGSKLPPIPQTDGTYTLQLTVTNGVPTYSWI